MKFLKSTLLGGLFVLLPLMLLWIGIKEIGGLLVEMATPIADVFPPGVFDNLTAPGVIALLLIVGTSFVLGLAAKAACLEIKLYWRKWVPSGKGWGANFRFANRLIRELVVVEHF